MPLVVRNDPALQALGGLFSMSASSRKAFDLLAKRGRLTATEAAMGLGKSRSRAYEVLRGLVSQGLAVEEPGRPVHFHVRPAREALASLKGDLEAKAALVEETLAALPTLQAEPARPPVSTTFFHGWPATERELLRLVRTAKVHLALLDGDPDNQLLGSPTIRASLLKAAARGVEVSLYSAQVPATNLTHGLEAGASREGVHVVRGLPPFSCLATETVAFYQLPGAKTGAGSSLSLRIANPDFATFTLQTLARLVGGLMPEGRGTADADEFLAAYTSALAKARRNVANVAGPGWHGLVGRHQFRIIQGHAESAAARGVHLRGLLHVDEANQDFLQRFARPRDWEIRAVEWIPVWTSVIDGNVMFQALLHREGATTYRWTRSLDEVRFNEALFEQAWAGARPVDVPARAPTARPRPNSKPG
jgi:hypothetical protein